MQMAIDLIHELGITAFEGLIDEHTVFSHTHAFPREAFGDGVVGDNPERRIIDDVRLLPRDPFVDALHLFVVRADTSPLMVHDRSRSTRVPGDRVWHARPVGDDTERAV